MSQRSLISTYSCLKVQLTPVAVTPFIVILRILLQVCCFPKLTLVKPLIKNSSYSHSALCHTPLTITTFLNSKIPLLKFIFQGKIAESLLLVFLQKNILTRLIHFLCIVDDGLTTSGDLTNADICENARS